MTGLPRRFTKVVFGSLLAGAVVCVLGFLSWPPLADANFENVQPDAVVATVVIEPVGEKMEFATKEIEAKSGTKLTIVMNNTATNPAMHHNVAVLDLAVNDGDGINAVGAAALEVGESAGYVPDHDAILAATSMAAPGERTEITFTVPPPGNYPYVCLYPGHYVVMRGTLVSVP